MLLSDFNITKRTVIDMVPKAIVLNLVQHAKETLQRELLAELYNPSALDDLLKESDFVVSRRKECLSSLFIRGPICSADNDTPGVRMVQALTKADEVSFPYVCHSKAVLTDLSIADCWLGMISALDYPFVMLDFFHDTRCWSPAFPCPLLNTSVYLVLLMNLTRRLN